MSNKLKPQIQPHDLISVRVSFSQSNYTYTARVAAICSASCTASPQEAAKRAALKAFTSIAAAADMRAPEMDEIRVTFIDSTPRESNTKSNTPVLNYKAGWEYARLLQEKAPRAEQCEETGRRD